MFNCHAYILNWYLVWFLDFTGHFDDFITLEDGWLESTTKILVF